MSLQQWNEVVISSNGDQKHHNYLEDKPLCLLFMVNKKMPNSLTPKIYEQEPSNLESQSVQIENPSPIKEAHENMPCNLKTAYKQLYVSSFFFLHTKLPDCKSKENCI